VPDQHATLPSPDVISPPSSASMTPELKLYDCFNCKRELEAKRQ
jgi:hypothetical protein